MNDAKEIGGRLRAARLRRRLSQAGLASAAGVTQSLVSQIERGVNRGSAHLSALARAVGVSLDWLETGTEPPPAGPAMTPLALHYPHAIVDVLALIPDPTGQTDQYWVVLRDEHEAQVVLRLADAALVALRAKLER